MARQQYGQYDRIFRENIEEVIPTLITKILNIQPVRTEELPDDIQHTKERRPDILKRITDVSDKTFILHLEIQLSDEMEMVYRMAEYDLMLIRKYRIPVEQFVIYIGKGKPKMPVKLITTRHQFEFPVVALSEIDYQLFLDAGNPSEIVFAILGNFKTENPQQAIIKIVKRVHETSPTDFSLKRHLVQLRVLSQIRKLEVITEKAMESIGKFFKEEKDFLFIKGREQGREEGREVGREEGREEGLEKGLEQGQTKKDSEKNLSFTESLILQTSFNNKKIAGLVGVSEDFVQAVRENLENIG